MHIPIPEPRCLPGGGALSIGDHAFRAVSEFIHSETGIRLGPSHRSMVEARLAKRVREVGKGCFDTYCRHVFENGGLAGERNYLVNALTTNTTHFYREPAHFEILARQVVPNLLRNGGKRRGLKIWSAASSNGSEAYSLAMVLASLQRRHGSFPFAVLGTDISTDVIAEARLAVYDTGMTTALPSSLRDRYLMRANDAARSNLVRVAPDIRKHVRFDTMNLMDETYPVDRDVDVIVLRNVLIYFGESERSHVLATLMDHLRPGGYLVLGHAEGSVGNGLGLEAVGPSMFLKK